MERTRIIGGRQFRLPSLKLNRSRFHEKVGVSRKELEGRSRREELMDAINNIEQWRTTQFIGWGETKTGEYAIPDERLSIAVTRPKNKML